MWEFEPYSEWVLFGLLTDEGGWGPLFKICRTYPPMMKFGTVIRYLKKFKRIYESRGTVPSAGIRIFSPKISKFCYINKHRYSLHFDT